MTINSPDQFKLLSSPSLLGQRKNNLIIPSQFNSASPKYQMPINNFKQGSTLQQIANVKSPNPHALIKPKCYNQLANLETTSSTETPIQNLKILNENISHPSNTYTISQPQNIVPQTRNIILPAEISQKIQNNFQAQPNNYIYKPLGINGNMTQFNTYQRNIVFQNNLPKGSPQLIPNSNLRIVEENKISSYSPYFHINNQRVNNDPLKPLTYQPYIYKQSNLVGNNSLQQNSYIPSQNVTNQSPNSNFVRLSPPVYNNYPTNPIQTNLPSMNVKTQIQIAQQIPKTKTSQNQDFLKAQGIKHIQSKIYQSPLYMCQQNKLQTDPKQTSIQFSLRISQHFEGLKMNTNY